MKRIEWVAGWVLLCFAAATGMAADVSFEQTAEERSWLAEHPEIHIGVRADFPPIHFTDGSGRSIGLGADVLDGMNRLLGGILRIHPAPFQENLQKIRSGELDGLMEVVPCSDGEKTFLFTQPYLDIPQVIVGKRDSRYYRTSQMLSGSAVAMERDIGTAAWFEENLPKVKVRLYDNTRDALDAVARGQVVAYVGNRAVALVLIEQEMLSNLHLEGRLDEPSGHLVLGVRKELPVAARLLDRAMGEVLCSKGASIRSKWCALASHAGGPFRPDAEGQAWLEANPRIRIGIPNDRPPMDYVDEAGQPRGIGVDFIELLNERLDGRILMVPGAGADLRKEAREGRLEALMDIEPESEEEAGFLFSKPYAHVPHVIIGRKGGEYFDSLESLSNRTVVVEAGFPIARHLREERLRIQVLEQGSTREALAAVSTARADAYVGSRAVATWLIARDLLSNLQIQGTVRETASVSSIGVRPDLPQLISILNAALASLSPQSVQEIYERWGGVGWSETAELSWIKLSPEEKQWLDEHPVIRVGSSPRWAPLEFVDVAGMPKGITHEYLDRFGKALGVKFRHVAIPSWRQAQAKLRDEEVDLLSGANKASAKKVDFEFTPPYLSLPTAIFMRENATPIRRIEELTDKKVAIVIGYAMENYLRTQCPGVHLEPVGDVPTGLRMLESGEVDAYVGNLLVTSHYIQRGGHARIKVAGDVDFVYQPAFVARQDSKMLIQILAKALAGVDDQEKNAIARKWMTITYEKHIDYQKLYKYVAGALALLVLFFYWNRRMAIEIRRRRVVEDSLRKNREALVAANKEMEAFSYSVSHDLRAPLRHVSGFVQLLQSNAKGKLDETGMRYLEVIAGAGKKMGDLIDDLLSFSRTGRAQMHLEPVPLGPLVDECRRELEPEMQGREIEWKIGELPEVAADRALLRQVLANLLGNAVKYTGKREIAHIEVSAKTEGEEIIVCVRDNGAGFDMKYVEKLFGVFQRLHTDEEFEGTGIGLANVHRIISRHGGRAWAEGEMDKGASFCFSLPVRPAEEEKEEVP